MAFVKSTLYMPIRDTGAAQNQGTPEGLIVQSKT